MNVGNFYLIETTLKQEQIFYLYGFVTAETNKRQFFDFYLSEESVENFEQLMTKGHLVVSRNWCECSQKSQWKLLGKSSIGREYLFPQFLYKREDQVHRVYRILDFFSIPLKTEETGIRINRDNFYLYRFSVSDLVINDAKDFNEIKMRIEYLKEFL